MITKQFIDDLVSFVIANPESSFSDYSSHIDGDSNALSMFDFYANNIALYGYVNNNDYVEIRDWIKATDATTLARIHGVLLDLAAKAELVRIETSGILNEIDAIKKEIGIATQKSMQIEQRISSETDQLIIDALDYYKRAVFDERIMVLEEDLNAKIAKLNELKMQV